MSKLLIDTCLSTQTEAGRTLGIAMCFHQSERQ